MTIHPSALIALFLCFFSVGVIMHYEQRIELIAVKVKLDTKYANEIITYNDCLSTSIDMSDVQGCIRVHGH